MHVSGHRDTIFLMELPLTVYVLGVLIGLWRTDASPAGRVALALLWPVGPLAFGATVVVLLGASLIAFPIVGGAVVALGGVLLWWRMG